MPSRGLGDYWERSSENVVKFLRGSGPMRGYFGFLTILSAGALLLATIFIYGPAGKKEAPVLTASIFEAFPLAPKSDRILLQGPGGGVWVNNFYKIAKAAMPEDNAALVVRAADYDIIYFRASGSFELALGISASTPAKDAAENSFFGVLGIGKQELCRLDIKVSSLGPGGDKEYSKLSFCQSVFSAR